MVNGKGLSSTMGDINLNPASVNTNQGGKINFHYNQSSSATSAIYEDVSGRIRVNGDLNFNGAVKSGLTVDSWIKGTVADNSEGDTWRDTVYSVGNSDGARIGMLRSHDKQESHQIQLTATNVKESTGGSVWASIFLTSKPDGTHTEALGASPATNDDSAQIATTAYTRAYTSATHLPLSGGTLTNNIAYKKSSITRGTAPSSVNYYDVAFRDSNSDFVSLYRTEYNTNKSSLTTIKAFNTTITGNNNNIGQIGVGCDSSGNVYTIAPTPATSDNSTKIATTAFVKNFYNDNISRLLVNHYQLSGAGNTVSFNMQGNIAVVFAKRDSRSILMVFDTWNSAPTILSYTGSNTFITGSMSSNWVTLTHGGETGSVVIIAFSGINAGHWFN